MLLNGRLDKKSSDASGKVSRDSDPREDLRQREDITVPQRPQRESFIDWDEDEAIEVYPTKH